MLLSRFRGNNDQYVLIVSGERWGFLNGLVHHSETHGSYIHTRLRNENIFMQHSNIIYSTS
jgi:hypothetical protein